MKFRENLSFKIAAIIFSYIMAVLLVASTALTAVMGYYKFYFSEQSVVREEILTDMAQNEAYHITNLLDWGNDLEKYYKDKNVFYRVTYSDSGEVLTNYNGEPYIAFADTGYYDYEEHLIEEKYGESYYDYKEIKLGEVEVFIARDMHKSDLFSVVAKIIDIGYRLRFAMVFISLGSLAVFIFLLCFLYCAAGHRRGEVIKCNFLDRLPFDFVTAAVTAIAVLSIVTVDFFWRDKVSLIIWLYIVCSVDYFVALGYTMSFATRIKNHTLVKNNIIYYILRFFLVLFHLTKNFDQYQHLKKKN